MSIGKFFKSIGQERIRVSLRRKQNRPEQRNVKRTERLKKETQVQARRSSEEVVTGEDVQNVVCGVDVCEEEPLYSQATNQVAGLALVVWGCFPAPPPPSSYVPDAVQNAAILENPQQLVICGDLVEIGSFLISKEQIWFPDGI